MKIYNCIIIFILNTVPYNFGLTADTNIYSEKIVRKCFSQKISVCKNIKNGKNCTSEIHSIQCFYSKANCISLVKTFYSYEKSKWNTTKLVLPYYLNVTMICQNEDEYVEILQVVYKLPSSQTEYCPHSDSQCPANSLVPACNVEDCCSDSLVNAEVTGMCALYEPVEQEWKDACNRTTTGTCEIEVPRKILPDCDVGYPCVHGNFNRCYARWVEITYQCVPRGTDPNNGQTGLIVGVSLGMILLCCLVVIVVILLRRKLKVSKKENEQSPQHTNLDNMINKNEVAKIDDIQDTDMTENTYYESSNQGQVTDGSNVDEMIQNTYYESGDIKDINGLTSTHNSHVSDGTMTDNTYYEGAPSLKLENKTDNSNVDGMIQNTYYESGDIKNMTITSDPLVIDDKMTENTYYEGVPSLKLENKTRVGNDLKNIEKQSMESEKQVLETNKDNSNYVYTYGHFKLEGRDRSPNV